MSKFEDLSVAEQEALRDEFEGDNTTRERRIEILTLLQEGSDEAEMGRPCPNCGHHPFYAPHDEPLIEGHVYSRDGLAEIRITGYCEFCFDLITAEPVEEDDEVWKQRVIAHDIDAMAEAMGPGTTVRRLSAEEVQEMFDTDIKEK